MRRLSSATTICRVLVGLDRARADGTLYLEGEGRSATFSFASGTLVGVTANRCIAVTHRQALERLLEVCDWDGLVLRLRQPPPAADRWTLSEPAPARFLALQAMRAAVTSVEAATIHAQLGIETYHLTAVGEALVNGAELRAPEASVLRWLRKGLPTQDLTQRSGCGWSGYRFLWMLKMLGAASPKSTGSYPLLLRKRRELRSRASAHALLDLPEGAGGRDARVALRKLVRDLHPDRFGDGAPPALRRASGEITTALVNAEAQIAAGQSK
ncbi:MAG: J domain-containing protein [Deltaproteobacteria bacterium]|nr:J domain-containing protein [Deltaproteobacteria bacterium]NNK07661.1 J domain-containing protein [Myxococcales bacterium]MBT8464703.1 J domain-containing protein [Deltaproteobacteria bacterium]MBT8480592.1 J domain-containing protein [Deltaproteobacteria bacterium]NNK43323.1 J domain-containing protein [Myxococcales bacterium]